MSGTVNKCAVKKHPKFTEIYFEFLLFYYDSDGSATSFSYNGTMYFYVKNLQGDVVRIIDLSGTEVASYVYDAWGNIKDTKGEPTIREINPIRYRVAMFMIPKLHSIISKVATTIH